MRLRNNKKLIFVIGIAVVLAIVGIVGALNGWFGGGGRIPEDTFSRGLVGYWSFDEGTGPTAHDASGQGHPGALTPPPPCIVDSDCPTCYYCSNHSCTAANTNWGADLYSCSGSNTRCYGGECRTCNNVSQTSRFYSDGCSGCAGQGGSACWRVADTSQSCTDFCSSYGGCVAANWNDDTDCTMMKALTGYTCYLECGGYSQGYNPQWNGSGGVGCICAYRTAGHDQDCGIYQSGFRRACVCQF